MPALFTSTSQWVTRLPSSSHDLASETSTRTKSPPISAATCLPSFSFKSPTNTLAPAPANARAMASPMPEAAPVTTAVFSVRLNIQSRNLSGDLKIIFEILPRHSARGEDAFAVKRGDFKCSQAAIDRFVCRVWPALFSADVINRRNREGGKVGFEEPLI